MSSAQLAFLPQDNSSNSVAPTERIAAASPVSPNGISNPDDMRRVVQASNVDPAAKRVDPRFIAGREAPVQHRRVAPTEAGKKEVVGMISKGPSWKWVAIAAFGVVAGLVSVVWHNLDSKVSDLKAIADNTSKQISDNALSISMFREEVARQTGSTNVSLEQIRGDLKANFATIHGEIQTVSTKMDAIDHKSDGILEEISRITKRQ